MTSHISTKITSTPHLELSAPVHRTKAPARFLRLDRFARLTVTSLALLVAVLPSLSRPLAQSDPGDRMDFGGPAPEERVRGDAADAAAIGSARVRFLDGDMKIARADDESVEAATPNSPVYSGDSVTTSTGGRAEIQLARGGVVRLDERTTLVFLSLPPPGSTGDDTVLQLTDGSVDVEVHKAPERDVDFRVDTPSASVYVLAAGRYRIDINGKYGQSRVSCYRGVAEVAGDEGSVMLRSGQRTLASSEREPDPARAFNTAFSDAFDGWVQDRTGVYYRADSGTRNDEDQVDEEEIPDVVQPYRSELSYYGNWVTVSPYGRCWVPGGVGTGWRPYSNGYWQYGPAGSFWVSYDTWGWAPYHYGRWVWAPGFGWAWTPGSVFSGAWVSWYYGPTYIGWGPLDFWDFPCTFRPGFIGIDYRCWNFVTYHNVYVRNVHRNYVPTWNVRNEVSHGGGVVVSHPVRFSPRDVREDRVTPSFVVRKAREIASSAPPSAVRDRVAKRSFRERETQVVQSTAGRARGNQAGTRSSAGASGGAGSAGSSGTTLRPRPRVRDDSPRAGQAEGARPRQAVPRAPRSGGSSTAPGSSAPPARPRGQRLPAHPRSSQLAPEVGGTGQSDPQGVSDRTIPRRRTGFGSELVPSNGGSDVASGGPTGGSGEGAPRRHPRAQEVVVPDGSDTDPRVVAPSRHGRRGEAQPDQNLREFFRDSAPRSTEPSAAPEPRRAPRAQAPPPQAQAPAQPKERARAPERRPEPPPKPAPHADKPEKPHRR